MATLILFRDIWIPTNLCWACKKGVTDPTAQKLHAVKPAPTPTDFSEKTSAHSNSNSDKAINTKWITQRKSTDKRELVEEKKRVKCFLDNYFQQLK